MSKVKRRGPVPSLIGGSNGRPKRIEVKGPSKCSRCEAALSKGQLCIAIPNLRSSFNNDVRYCDGCFQDVLRKTEEDLEELKKL